MSNTDPLLRRIAQQVEQSLLDKCGKHFDRDWLERAACKDTKYDFFIPLTFNRRKSMNVNIYQHRLDAAIQLSICRECPVKDICEQQHRHEEFGIWFDTVPLERRRGQRAQINWRDCDCMACSAHRYHNSIRAKNGIETRRMLRERREERAERRAERGRKGDE